MSDTEVKKKDGITFSKEKLLTFKRYAGRTDLLNTLLEAGREYTFAEVNALINKFMKGR